MKTFFMDNGPDYSCPKCGTNTTGEIGHECGENPEMEYEIFPHPERPKKWVGKSMEEIKFENTCPTCKSIKAPLCLFCGGCPICDPDYCKNHGEWLDKGG